MKLTPKRYKINSYQPSITQCSVVPKHYSILLLNIQGFTPDATSIQRWKLDYLTNFVYTSPCIYPIIALSETWLKPKHSDAQISIENYTIFRSDRIKRGRGGTLLYMHKSIPITSSDKYDDDVCQAIFLKSIPMSLMIACIYKPCDTSASSFSKVLSFLHKCTNSTKESDNYTLIILGDFNFPDMWTVSSEDVVAQSESEIMLKNFMNNNFLCQYVDVATRNQNILDLCLSNNDRLVQQVTSEKHEISDHNVVEIRVPSSEFKLTTYGTDSSKPSLYGFNALDLHSANFDKISETLNEINWENEWQNSSLEEFPKILQSLVLDACVKHAPQKGLSKKNPSKYKRSYRTILRKKRKLQSRLNCIKQFNPSSAHILTIENKIKFLTEELKISTFNFQQRNERRAIERIKLNPKYFFSFAKKFAKSKQGISQLLINDGEVATDRKVITDALQDQFCASFSDPTNGNKTIPISLNPKAFLSDIILTPDDFIHAIDEINANSSTPDFAVPAIVLKNCKNSLCKPLYLMWRESLNSGVVPAFYKRQMITPTYKKGSRSLPLNYRPISLTPHEIKIFERVLRKKMMDFLESNELLSCKQHGFQKGKSCLSQLLKQYDDILNNLLDQNETDVIYLDFSKAFDKVDHQILFRKLSNIGISGNLLAWLQNFLTDRNQTVVVDGVLSYVALVLSGVPQGTVLGPLLFLIYINDISNCLHFSEISCFADDSRIFKSISYTHDTQLLQKDLFNISSWSISNNMKLHDDKFVYMNFNIRPNKFPLANLPFYSSYFQYKTSTGNILEQSDTVTDLGVILSDNLSWTPHISAITRKAKQQAGWALSVFKDRSPLVMKTLYKSVIRPHLEYGCALWCGLSMQNLRDLEAIQRSFTNKTVCPPHIQNYWDRLQYLQLMSLQRRRERYVILYMWKILNGKTSNDLNICFYDNPRRGILARVPPLSLNSSLKAKTLYDSSFAVVGPNLWNVVPKSIKSIESLVSFKANLDIFLKEFPDRPPVSGYIVQNNNSLTEWYNTRTH